MLCFSSCFQCFNRFPKGFQRILKHSKTFAMFHHFWGRIFPRVLNTLLSPAAAIGCQWLLQNWLFSPLLVFADHSCQPLLWDGRGQDQSCICQRSVCETCPVTCLSFRMYPIVSHCILSSFYFPIFQYVLKIFGTYENQIQWDTRLIPSLWPA